MSIRPSAPFPIDNLNICSWIFFFKFCIHIVIGEEWYGFVNGQNPSIFNTVTALVRTGKTVSGRLFLDQGLTNPLSGCPGQVKIFAGQVKIFLTCPEKCINYIGKTNKFQGFQAEAICRTSRSDFNLSSPA